ncbi:MAG: tetratricopeptide repeat protein [Gemmatimonadaceae bacterium]
MATISDVRRASLTLILPIVTACATAHSAAPAGSGTTAARPLAVAHAQPPKDAMLRADNAYQAGDYASATALFEAIVLGESSPPSLAVFRLATLRSWDSRLDEAVGLYRRYIVQEPRDAEGRLALARTLAWGGHYASAIAIYDTLIASNQRLRDATVGRAQTQAWAGDVKGALAVYAAWTRDHPSDREASMDYARTLAWNNQMDEAETLYTQLSRTGNATATKGLARVIGWKGDLERSEQTWRRVLTTDPADPEALTGLAQVLSWQGRQTDAESALELALRSNPGYGDARTLLRWVRADLRPSMTVSGISINDSDKNRSTGVVVDYVARAWWNGAIGGTYTGRSANFQGIDSRADAGNIFGRWQPAGSSWQLRADGNLTHHSSTFVSPTSDKRTIGGGALRVSGKVGHTLTLGFSAARSPFDETALLIANGVVSSEITSEGQLALPGRVSISGAGSRARLTGGTAENARNAFSSTLRWTGSRRWSIAVTGRQFEYDTTSSDGYFAPRRYTLAEASGRAHIGSSLGWNADADIGLGHQSVELFGAAASSRMAERASFTFGYRFDPAREISASGGYANVAAAGQRTGSEYKWNTFALRARLGF